MRAHLLLLTMMTLGACARHEEPHREVVIVPPIDGVRARLDRGDFGYFGGQDDGAVTVDVVSWGRAGSRGRAKEKERTNDWGVSATADGLLEVWAVSEAKGTGVDIALTGPTEVNVNAITERGSAYLEDVLGSHVVTADEIVALGIVGEADLSAEHGSLELDIDPYTDATITLQVFKGDLFLAMPFGLDYDIEVVGDPDWGMFVTDLGFDTLYLTEEYMHAATGRGEIKVYAEVFGGTFNLFEAL